MADALCGPSNALHSFKDHTQVDRTLQQDRLTSGRHPPGESFRTPDPRAGSLDAEFTAFEAGPQQPYFLQQQQPASHHGFGPVQQPSLSLQQTVQPAPQWVADFQNLQLGIRTHQPLPPGQYRVEAPLLHSKPRADGGSWHNEFMPQIQHNQTSLVNEKSAMRSHESKQDYLQGRGPPYHQFELSQPAIYQPTLSSDQQEHYRPEFEVENEAAFEAAFAQAENASSPVQNLAQQDPPLTEEVAIVGHTEHSIRIGADTIPAPSPATHGDPEKQARDADELAKCAGALVASVQDDKSAKFENSQFLALLRQIRDGKVVVEGQEFKQVAALPDTNQNLISGKQRPQQGTARENARTPSASEQILAESHLAPRDQYLEEVIQSQRMGRENHNMGVSEEFPQALHPGGNRYPAPRDGRETHEYDHWASGGIGIGDFEVDHNVNGDDGVGNFDFL